MSSPKPEHPSGAPFSAREDRDPLHACSGAECHRWALVSLGAAKVEFLVGGGYELAWHLGAAIRPHKDLDLFVRSRDADAVLAALAAAGYRTERTTHWLAKAFCRAGFIDVIFRSGNGAVNVDDRWFERAIDAAILGVPVRLCPLEEAIWSRSFVMERERFDGGDIAHLLKAYADRLDWRWLLFRFGAHWRVLAAHLVLFGFIYPTYAHRIPRWVTCEMIARLDAESATACGQPRERVCCGTLLSRLQYASDVASGELEDARLEPRGSLTRQEAEQWTRAGEEEVAKS